MTCKPRFAETFCSQCGANLGPGDEGVSHCIDHAPRYTPVACPFCDEDDFDRIGLKLHLMMGNCTAYNDTPTTDRPQLPSLHGPGSRSHITPQAQASRRPGPWSVVALLRKPGEPRAPYVIRRLVWTAAGPVSEYLRTDDGSTERRFDPDDYEDARTVARRMNDARGVSETANCHADRMGNARCPHFCGAMQCSTDGVSETSDAAQPQGNGVKDCHTCAHRDSAGSKGPCKSCTRLWAEENGGHTDNWTPIPLGVSVTEGKPK